MKNTKSILFLFIILSSCIKELDYQVDEVPKQLIINSIIASSQPITVNVSCLQSILDTSLSFIGNANVIIEESGGEIDTLNYESEGNYVSYLFGKPGKFYQLTVIAEGFPSVFAIDTVPILVPIHNASKEQSLTVDQYGDPHADFTVSFSKKSGICNYYELFFVKQFRNHIDSLFSIYYWSDAVNIDPLVLESGITDFKSATFLFSDATIADGEYSISMKMIDGLYNGGIFKDPVVPEKDNVDAIVLRTVSKAYYNYRCSWEKHRYFKNDIAKVENWTQIIMAGEPQEMFTNIENGLGIFVAYNQDAYLY